MKPCKLSRLASDGDRITNLHETVMSHIMSRLPTKDAVRTSILSKDWRYKWTSSYNVDIDDYYHEVGAMKKPFVNFVHGIFFCPQRLRSFRLKCGSFYDLRHIQTWISTALRRNLESLEVQCLVKGIVFPCSLLNSIWLRKLNLEFWDSTLNVTAKNCAPNLTSLDLFRVEIVNNGNCNTSTTVTFNFPLLETFTVRGCKWLNVKSVEIYAPSLTTFKSAPINCEDQEYDYSFVIRAPRLASFTCEFGLPENFVLENGSSIVTAKLNSGGEPRNPELLKNIGIRIGKLLSEFTNLQVLELSEFMAEVSRLGPPLHHREKLRQLTFRDPSNAEQLLELLHVAPSLKLLRINVLDWVDYDYGRISSVPSCIVSNLEEVEFGGFECEKPQYNLAKFLLKNGQQLKKLTIVDRLPREKQRQVKEHLSAFPSVPVEFVY